MFLSKWYRYANDRSTTRDVYFQSTADQVHSLLHAQDPNAILVRRLLGTSRRIPGDSGAAVDDFECKVRVTVKSNYCLTIARVSLDVCQALLHHAK